MRVRAAVTSFALMSVGVSACLTGSVLAADHREAPLITEDPSADINDVYVFTNPSDAGRLVLAMTVHPLTAPPQNAAAKFSPNVRYRFEIDLNNDGKSERSVFCTFKVNDDGSETMHVDLPGTGNDFDAPATPGSVAVTAPAPTITNVGGVSAFAGQRDDPFFFDNVGFNRFRAGTGTFGGHDGFAGTNVSIIAIEAPFAVITGGARQFQVWGATDRQRTTIYRSKEGKLEKATGPFEQIERMGNPAISTVLITKKHKDLFNIGVPKNDAKDFGPEIAASLQGLGTNQANIAILASVAIPDTLKVDLDKPIAFPNGRKPADDVIDTLLYFIFNQPSPAPTDGVNSNDKAFLNTFPYFAAPWQPA